MKALLQRVKSAQVTVDQQQVGAIGKGLLVYICFEVGDELEGLEKAVSKILGLRIFEDEAGKMNLSVKDLNLEVLSVSQFTLSWNGKKGFRPSFDQSMPPQKAKMFYAAFNERISALGIRLQEGVFGADMQVSCVNDGPVTFFLDF